MTLKSSRNSFYRYLIRQPEDISINTLIRRTKKRDQNFKTGFFYELVSDIDFQSKSLQFIKDNIKPSDLLLVSPRFLPQIEENKIHFSQVVLHITSESELSDLLNIQLQYNFLYLFSPLTKAELNLFYDFSVKNLNSENIFWRFRPYNPDITNSLTISDIANFKGKLSPFPNLEIHNSNAPEHYEFVALNENGYQIEFKWVNSTKRPKLSIIIPTFNNKKFLNNVVFHLLQQNCEADKFEVIIADDGSTDESSATLSEMHAANAKNLNLTYLYWPKTGARGNQDFFRAGLIRNLAVNEAQGDLLLFLDSDMLVPTNFVDLCIDNLSNNDIIQFQRFHINQDLSHTSPSYSGIDIKRDTYIEEEKYWSQLFQSSNWSSLPQYWKYTCTYALGINKESFLKIGMFKKYYISYGFEDTDLGYECHLRDFKFKLVKIPLLHLTAYDKMQYKNSAKKRLQLLRVTAELFYLQHLDNQIYHLLIDFYRFQKPLKSIIRDLID